MREYLFCPDCGRIFQEVVQGEALIMPSSDYEADCGDNTVFEIKCNRCKLMSKIIPNYGKLKNKKELIEMAARTQKKRC